jgi:transposase-like protein
MAGRKNHSSEDIVLLLQRINELLGNGSTIELSCREVGVRAASYYKWRQRYEGMSIDDARGLKGSGRRTANSNDWSLRLNLRK